MQTTAPHANHATATWLHQMQIRRSAWSSPSTRETPRSDPIRRRRDGRRPVRSRGFIRPRVSTIRAPDRTRKNTDACAVLDFTYAVAAVTRRLMSRACRRPAAGHSSKQDLDQVNSCSMTPWIHRSRSIPISKPYHDQIFCTVTRPSSS